LKIALQNTVHQERLVLENIWGGRNIAKNLVICCDGTGNEIGYRMSNVLKLFRVAQKNQHQQVYYNPGIGTIGEQNAWQRGRAGIKGVFGLVTGQGLDEDVLDTYRFLCTHYEDGDKIWLFGFSRGAYTARVLAAFVHCMGLLPVDQLNLACYAFAAYKRASAENPAGAKLAAAEASVQTKAVDDHDERLPAETGLEAVWHFAQIAGADPAQIEFIGVWDTVASMIVPRDDAFWFDLQTLRFTRTNPSVKTFRHAMAIDERRRLFRLNKWIPVQPYRPDPYRESSKISQDVKQVWFAGDHSDVGGGYPETESAVAKFPLYWMIEEAVAKGLLVNRAMVNHVVLGHERKGSNHNYVEPDATADTHDSMQGFWHLPEWLPKRAKWREAKRRSLLGLYMPRSEPRSIPDDALIHRSVIERRDAGLGYKPINLPAHPQIETFPIIPSKAETKPGKPA
jgi:uncharacterized protein (DUF2235 family)